MKKKLLFLIPTFVGVGLFAQVQKVGVNTDDPQATLDIHGNMAIEKVDVAKSDDNPQQLVWNSQSREVQVNKLGKTFYILDYRIEAYETDAWYSQARQWVSDFDTKIPLNYNVIFSSVTPYDRDHRFNIIDIMHSQGSNNKQVAIIPSRNDLNPIEKGHQEKTITSDADALRVNPVIRKVLWEQKDTNSWHFTLGFPGGRPDNINATSSNDHRIAYEWHVRLIAIPKKISSVTEPEEVAVEGTQESGWNPVGEYKKNPLD